MFIVYIVSNIWLILMSDEYIFFLYQWWCCQMLWATYYFLSLYDLWLGKQKTIQSTQNRFVYKNTHSKAFEKKNIWILWKYLLSVPLEFRWNLYITNKFNIKLLFFIDFSSIFIDLVLKLLVRSLKFRLWAQNKVVSCCIFFILNHTWWNSSKQW